MNKDAPYWERGVSQVPFVTGASKLLDARDMKELADALHFKLPLGSVLDVGCGTGRIAKHCERYHGVDISRDAVHYCQQHGLAADVIEGPDSLIGYEPVDVITCMSVFTHISDGDRALYLAAFAPIALWLLVDIIPGTGGGDVAAWTAKPEEFVEQLKAFGFKVDAVYEKAEDGFRHRYYWCYSPVKNRA